MKAFIFATTFIIIFSTVGFASLTGNIFESGLAANNGDWGFGFNIRSSVTQNVRIWMFLEIAGEIIYVADHGFEYTEMEKEYGTFYMEENDIVSQQCLKFTWPENALPMFYHFWIWMYAEGSSGDELKKQTQGVTFWGDYYTPNQSPSPFPTTTPTPTQAKTWTPTPTPSPSITPTPTPSAMARPPAWYLMR